MTEQFFELGGCPFCHGRVRAGIGRTGDAERPSWTATPECPNGCQVGRVDTLTVEAADVRDAEWALRRQWEADCGLMKNPTLCVRCGARPMFERFDNGWRRFGCFDCERWLSGDDAIMEFERGWTLWNTPRPSENEK